MIAALLFLILFALLFPKALRFLFALLFIGGIVLLGEVHAANYPYCHGNKACNNEYKISMATCFSMLAVKGLNAADPRYREVCSRLTEDKVRQIPDRTETGLCVGDYSLKQINGRFVAKSLTQKNCPQVTIESAH